MIIVLFVFSDLSKSLEEAIEYELSLCDADFVDCNIEVTESKDIFIPGCGAEQYPNRPIWQRVLSVEEGKIIELNIKDVQVGAI